MFSFAADNNSSDEEAELDFGPNTSTSNSAGLGSLFGSERHTAASNTKLVYQAPKQPGSGSGSGAETKMRTVEIVQEKEEEKLEVMSNVRSGVKMATAVSAYKYENGGYESLGKLGLAIIGIIQLLPGAALPRQAERRGRGKHRAEVRVQGAAGDGIILFLAKNLKWEMCRITMPILWTRAARAGLCALTLRTSS